MPGDGGDSFDSRVSAVMVVVEDDGCRVDVSVDVDSLPGVGLDTLSRCCLCTVRLSARA